MGAQPGETAKTEVSAETVAQPVETVTAPVSSAARRGKKIALVLHVTFSIVFIAVSAYQIAADVLEFRAREGGPTTLSQDEPCVAKLRSRERALERAVARALPAAESADAMALFREGLSPEWDEPFERSVCDEALAALVRVRRAEESLISRHAREVGPEKRAFWGYVTK